PILKNTIAARGYFSRIVFTVIQDVIGGDGLVMEVRIKGFPACFIALAQQNENISPCRSKWHLT
ncbi:MAG TPA: hypothetical protein VKN73_11500, partial [Desulfosalsimonadaceae bacterium]|nr:hypothetical protein [Desulfosalsimonadaceae bacterium]